MRSGNFTADLGQEGKGTGRAKAKAAGVKEIYVEDLREEFVREYVFPMFRRMPYMRVNICWVRPLHGR